MMNTTPIEDKRKDLRTLLSSFNGLKKSDNINDFISKEILPKIKTPLIKMIIPKMNLDAVRSVITGLVVESLGNFLKIQGENQNSLLCPFSKELMLDPVLYLQGVRQVGPMNRKSLFDHLRKQQFFNMEGEKDKISVCRTTLRKVEIYVVNLYKQAVPLVEIGLLFFQCCQPPSRTREVTEALHKVFELSNGIVQEMKVISFGELREFLKIQRQYYLMYEPDAEQLVFLLDLQFDDLILNKKFDQLVRFYDQYFKERMMDAKDRQRILERIIKYDNSESSLQLLVDHFKRENVPDKALKLLQKRLDSVGLRTLKLVLAYIELTYSNSASLAKTFKEEEIKKIMNNRVDTDEFVILKQYLKFFPSNLYLARRLMYLYIHSTTNFEESFQDDFIAILPGANTITMTFMLSLMKKLYHQNMLQGKELQRLSGEVEQIKEKNVKLQQALGGQSLGIAPPRNYVLQMDSPPPRPLLLDNNPGLVLKNKEKVVASEKTEVHSESPLTPLGGSPLPIPLKKTETEDSKPVSFSRAVGETLVPQNGKKKLKKKKPSVVPKKKVSPVKAKKKTPSTPPKSDLSGELEDDKQVDFYDDLANSRVFGQELFIGNVSPKISYQELHSMLENQCGEGTVSDLKVDKHFAFATFGSPQNVLRALELDQNTYQGFPFDMYPVPSELYIPKKYCVVVKGFVGHVKRHDVKKLFMEFGVIIDIIKMGYVFSVDFISEEMAVNCLKFHKKTGIYHHGTLLTVFRDRIPANNSIRSTALFFRGTLALSISPSEVKRHFAQYGRFRFLNIKQNYGYLEYDKVEEADRAVKLGQYIQGKRIYVRKEDRRNRKFIANINTKSVVIGHFKKNSVSPMDVREYFKACGKIVELKMTKHFDKAQIEFATFQGAEKALRRNGKTLKSFPLFVDTFPRGYVKISRKVTVKNLPYFSPQSVQTVFEEKFECGLITNVSRKAQDVYELEFASLSSVRRAMKYDMTKVHTNEIDIYPIPRDTSYNPAKKDPYVVILKVANPFRTEREVKRLIGDAGVILSIKFSSNKTTCYVEFQSLDGVEQCIFKGGSLYYGGRRVRIERKGKK